MNNLIEFLPQAGSPDDLVQALRDKLDQLAEVLNTKIVVTSGYRPQSDGSQHQLGKAADVMIPAGIPLMDAYKAAEACGFQGIGIYPDWNLSGKKLGGIHVDVRDKDGPHAKWMGVMQGGGKQIYIGLTEENLKKYGVV